MIAKDDIVVSYWAIGPSYRQALIRTLEQHVFSRSEHFNVIILTDHVDDFAKFITEPRLLTILDINEQRKHYTWSSEIEPIPSAKTQQQYSEQFWEILRSGKRFSYSLHRFSIPWLVSNGYHKFILADGDARIGNTHTVLQDWVTDCLDRGTKLVALGDVRKEGPLFDKFYRTMADVIQQKFPDITLQECPLIHEHQDGPFRFYNFASGYEAFRFFEVWNELVRYVLGENILSLQETGMFGGIVYNDEFILSVVNRFLNITHQPISGPSIIVEHDPVDVRFYALSYGEYRVAATQEEFRTINNLLD